MAEVNDREIPAHTSPGGEAAVQFVIRRRSQLELGEREIRRQVSVITFTVISSVAIRRVGLADKDPGSC
jgi:hypothetical protein